MMCSLSGLALYDIDIVSKQYAAYTRNGGSSRPTVQLVNVSHAAESSERISPRCSVGVAFSGSYRQRQQGNYVCLTCLPLLASSPVRLSLGKSRSATSIRFPALTSFPEFLVFLHAILTVILVNYHQSNKLNLSTLRFPAWREDTYGNHPWNTFFC